MLLPSSSRRQRGVVVVPQFVHLSAPIPMSSSAPRAAPSLALELPVNTPAAAVLLMVLVSPVNWSSSAPSKLSASSIIDCSVPSSGEVRSPSLFELSFARFLRMPWVRLLFNAGHPLHAACPPVPLQ